MRESRPSAFTRPNVARIAASVAVLAAFSGAVTTAAQAQSEAPVEVLLSTPSPSPTPPAPTPPVPAPTPAIPQAPIVKSLSPANGPAAGGNELVIGNSSYGRTHTVTIGGVPAEIVGRTTVNNGEAGTLETAVTVKVPAGTPGTTVDVILDNRTSLTPPSFGGISLPTELSKYTYDAAPEEPSTVDLAYGLTGNALFKTLAKGVVPLNGSVKATLDTASGAFTGALAIDPGTAKLNALGLIPVSAKIAIEPTEPLSGTLTGTDLAAAAKVRIKLPSVSVLGIQLVGGANCQAKRITSVVLASTDPFSPAAGGRVAGTFSLSDLTGCGALTNLVSPLTSGSGNLLAVNLTPKA
ncbi:MAG: hypothetical protein Q7T55_21445 [Solirubrobacteraceae bacterium]|nr:hypothetical protein [Solirubrobacteraceae bacterium]